MGEYIKEIQIQVLVCCYESLQVGSYVTAEKTKMVNEEGLKKLINRTLTDALIKQGLHPSEVNAFVMESVHDEIT